MKIKDHQKLVMIGDSVTDAGRARPIAEGLFDPLGTGYPRVVNQLLNAVYPERHIHVVNVGISGNTSRDLKERWQTDVFDLKPDWLSIMIGVNDVWRQFDSPTMPQLHILPEEYEANLRWMIEHTRDSVKGIVLMTPYYMEPNQKDAMRARMDEYGAICRTLAQEYDLIFVDTQKMFDDLLKHNHSSFIAWDRIHPNSIGHAALAKAFLDAINFEWK